MKFKNDIDRKQREFTCPKCGCAECVKHSMSAPGGGLFRALFGANTNEYRSLVCQECGFVEWYAEELSRIV